MATGDRARLDERRAALEVRGKVLRALRRWFEDQGFLEVETPARVRSPGQELHLDAIPSDDLWLITSPEYHMKRLVAAGHTKIVQIGKSWRAGERGPHHEPEFTMIEWYRAEAPLDQIATDCESLVRIAARAAGVYPEIPVPSVRATSGGAAAETVRVDESFTRTTVAGLFRAHAGIELSGEESLETLRAKAAATQALNASGSGSSMGWDDLFFQIFLDRVEPHLGRAKPTFVFDWPLQLAALARKHPMNPSVVERFELYAGGLELANAFGELTDANEQRTRFEAEAAERARRGKAVYPIDEKLIAAVGAMPPTSGVALGFDRLVMLVTGAAEIRDVMAFAHDEI